MSELKENFLAKVVSGDYLPNEAGKKISFLLSCIRDNEMELIEPNDWTLSGFDELYESRGRKNWLLKKWVEKNLPQQFEDAGKIAPEISGVDCLKIVMDIPELRQCIEYANHLNKLFQQKIADVRAKLSSEPKEILVKKMAGLIKEFDERRHTTRFDPEKDPEYQKQKEAAEAAAEPPNDRR